MGKHLRFYPEAIDLNDPSALQKALVDLLNRILVRDGLPLRKGWRAIDSIINYETKETRKEILFYHVLDETRTYVFEAIYRDLFLDDEHAFYPRDKDGNNLNDNEVEAAEAKAKEEDKDTGIKYLIEYRVSEQKFRELYECLVSHWNNDPHPKKRTPPIEEEENISYVSESEDEGGYTP